MVSLLRNGKIVACIPCALTIMVTSITKRQDRLREPSHVAPLCLAPGWNLSLFMPTT